jgi:glycosyltransferase involved in cell wall biosynthesis
MQKIAILVNTLESGGAEKQSIFLLNALKNDFQTYFVVFYGNRVDDRLIQLVDGDIDGLIRMQGNLFIKLVHLYKFLKSNQITHLFTYLTKPNFYGALIGHLAGIKHIYGSIRTSKLPCWKRVLEKISANHLSTATIFNSNAGERIFQKKGMRGTIAIPNCFPNVSDPIQREQKAIPKIITIGRFVEDKDYSTAIKAIQKLKETNNNFFFQIVGYGPMENKIRNKIGQLNVAQNVQILINPNNIPELLGGADIYLSTSLFEGTSNSIMEAMNASLPIVATNVGDNDKLVSEGASGFLHDVGDYNAIARSLKVLVNDYKRRVEFGVESNNILRVNYSYKLFKNKYFKLIEQ